MTLEISPDHRSSHAWTSCPAVSPNARRMAKKAIAARSSNLALIPMKTPTRRIRNAAPNAAPAAAAKRPGPSITEKMIHGANP